MRVAASWSGGKESCLAYYRAMLDGFEVAYLLNFVSKDGRCISHGLDSKLMVVQSKAIGVPIIQREVTLDAYEEGFKAAMRELKQMGAEGVVFGDIKDIPGHVGWVNRVCSVVGIDPIKPLWGLNNERILIDFVEEGFEAIVVKVKADLFGEEWLGRKVDKSFIEGLQKLRHKHDFDICGELGEYHTFVTDGPIFKRRIKILESRRAFEEGYWESWLLDILRYRVEEK